MILQQTHKTKEMKRLRRIHQGDTYYLKGFTPLGVEYTTEKTKALRVKDNLLGELQTTLERIGCPEGYFTLEGCRNSSKASLFDPEEAEKTLKEYTPLGGTRFRGVESLLETLDEYYFELPEVTNPYDLQKIILALFGKVVELKEAFKFFERIENPSFNDEIEIYKKYYIADTSVDDFLSKSDSSGGRIKTNLSGVRHIVDNLFFGVDYQGDVVLDFYELLKNGYKVAKESKHKEKQLELFV